MTTFAGRIEALMTLPSGAAVSATNVAGGPSTVTVPAASYYLTAVGSISSILTVFQTQLTTSRPPASGGWTVTLGTDGRVTIACTELYSITWTSTVLRDVLGFTGNITSVTTATGAAQAKGLWYPDCPINLDGDPSQTPTVSDLKTSQSPTGVTFGQTGNTFYRHTGVAYSLVPRAQVWDSAATYENGSWEEFFAETQLGTGVIWFSPSSPIQVYWSENGSLTLLGAVANGWVITSLANVEPRKAVDQWTGFFRVELGTLVSSG